MIELLIFTTLSTIVTYFYLRAPRVESKKRRFDHIPKRFDKIIIQGDTEHWFTKRVKIRKIRGGYITSTGRRFVGNNVSLFKR